MTRTWERARMISPPSSVVGAPLLRTEVVLDTGHGEVGSAWLHLSAHGIVEATLGGLPVGDELMAPGWTCYQHRLRYSSHEVTDLLEARTVLGLSLGNGWWRGRLVGDKQGRVYGDRLAAIAELHLVFADGHRQVVGTDGSWLARGSEVVSDDRYDGQTIDFRLQDDSWQRPGADLTGWSPVEVVEADLSVLQPSKTPPIRRQEVVRPQRIWTSPAGATLVDFGQNLVGFLRFSVTGERGAEVVLRHAEVVEGGELGVRPLRSAKATDRLVLSGGQDRFEPTKTFHGFRYAEVSGWPGELTPDEIEAVVVHSDLRRIGTFECSDPALNQLHRNIVWSWRGNSVGLPTDCPQRDERLGWTGDISVFAPTAAFLYDVGEFVGDWLRDLAIELDAQGRVPFVVPDALGAVATEPWAFEEGGGVLNVPTALWGDAAVWVPWALWTAYGDRDALAEAYPSMLAHLRSVLARCSPSGLWDTGFQFGDWLDPTAPPDDPYQAKTDKGVFATACLYRSLRTVAEAAAVLGIDDVRELHELADRTRKAFRHHYVRPDGRVHSDAATAYVLAIVFGLLDEERDLAGARLAELHREADHTILTGFAGTPYVLDALTMTGHLDEAYALLMNRRCPSWLYQVDRGATTVWERWDAMLPDGSINPGEMTSFNHTDLGAVGDWLHRTVGGLAPLEPGYRRVRIAPRPGGGLTWARTRLESRHGPISVSWQRDDGQLVVEVSLPDGVEGVLDSPGQVGRVLTAGEHRVVSRP